MDKARGGGGGGGYGGGAGGMAVVRGGKPSAALALRATQVSMALLGCFDRLHMGKLERKWQLSKSIHGKKRKQFDANINGSGGTNGKCLQSEAQQSSEILNRVINGPRLKEREWDVRKGNFFRGEMAYDYKFSN
jgi:hypothetical protein